MFLSCIHFSKSVNVSKVLFWVLWVVRGNYLRSGLWEPSQICRRLGSCTGNLGIPFAAGVWSGTVICDWDLNLWSVLTPTNWWQNWIELLDTQLVPKNRTAFYIYYHLYGFDVGKGDYSICPQYALNPQLIFPVYSLL